RSRRHAQVALWAGRAPGWSSGELDALVAAQAEQALSLAHEMQLASDDPAWRARDPGFTALARLGDGALARDDVVRAERLFSQALDLAGDDIDLDRVADVRTGRAAARVALHRLDEAEADLSPARDSPDLARRASALVVLG